ncbi:MAG: ABC transporter ATP-binding protein [bacterium]|nr:ABC transporter ATP-binding protein [bacterium]
MDTSCPAIEVRDLHVDFKGRRGQIVHAAAGLNIRVEQGDVVGFIGPNGAGKTTTIKVLLDFVKPTKGETRLFGNRTASVENRRRIGYLPEVALYYPFLTAREALGLYAKLVDIPSGERPRVVSGLLERVGLAARGDDRLRTFSKGMLQRVGIAQAIMNEPDLLILDEVTSGLDPVARYDVRRILQGFKDRGKTVFFSSHELTEVTRLCDRIVLVDEGRVIEERRVPELLASVKRYSIVARTSGRPLPVPDGIERTPNAEEGVDGFVTSDASAHDALMEALRSNGMSVLEDRRESGSLEEYFVGRIGHKTT